MLNYKQFVVSQQERIFQKGLLFTKKQVKLWMICKRASRYKCNVLNFQLTS